MRLRTLNDDPYGLHMTWRLLPESLACSSVHEYRFMTIDDYSVSRKSLAIDWLDITIHLDDSKRWKLSQVLTKVSIQLIGVWGSHDPMTFSTQARLWMPDWMKSDIATTQLAQLQDVLFSLLSIFPTLQPCSFQSKWVEYWSWILKAIPYMISGT